MPFEYKPRGLYDAEVDTSRCKAAVSQGGRAVGFYQCQRKPKIDGWCKQHHPDIEAARREASLLRSKQKFENRPYIRCLRKLEKVTAQRDALLAALKAVIRQANSGEWHSDIDCAIEGRRDSCRLCEATEEGQAAIALVAKED